MAAAVEVVPSRTDPVVPAPGGDSWSCCFSLVWRHEDFAAIEIGSPVSQPGQLGARELCRALTLNESEIGFKRWLYRI